MKKYSGKFILRLPPLLHRTLSENAASAALSLNAYCLKRLFPAVKEEHRWNGKEASISRWTERICQVWKGQVVGVVLFGSAAREMLRADSDIDLLIVFKSDSSVTRKDYQLWDKEIAPSIANYFANEVSPHFAILPSSVFLAGSLWYEIAIEGLVIWQDDYRVIRFLTDIRREIASGKIKRYTSHGHPYWHKEGLNA